MHKLIGAMLFTLFASGFSNAQSALDLNSGQYFGFGLGFSPIYIEELYAEDSFQGGSYVITFHSLGQYGLVLNDISTLYLTDSRNWYNNIEGAVVTSGITGVGASYFPRNFYSLYGKASGGLASKMTIGENGLASGLGVNLGLGWNAWRQLNFELNYNLLNFASASSNDGADTEVISSLAVSMSFFWQ